MDRQKRTAVMEVTATGATAGAHIARCTPRHSIVSRQWSSPLGLVELIALSQQCAVVVDAP